MHKGVADSAEDVTVIREIPSLISNKTNGHNLPWRNESVNVERIDRESMSYVQRFQLNCDQLTDVNGECWVIVVDFSVLKIGNIRYVETPRECGHDNIHGLRVRIHRIQGDETHQCDRYEHDNDENKCSTLGYLGMQSLNP